MEVERLGERPHEECFAEAGHAFQQAMPADEQAREHTVHNFVMPHNHAANLFPHRVVTLSEFLRPFFNRFTNTHIAHAFLREANLLSFAVTILPNVAFRPEQTRRVRIVFLFSGRLGLFRGSARFGRPRGRRGRADVIQRVIIADLAGLRSGAR